MPAPSQGPYDNFASDGNFPAGSDPWNGQPNTVTPSTGFITRGFMAGEKFVVEYLNFFLRNIYLWISWLNELATGRVQGPGTTVVNRLARWADTTGTAIKNSIVSLTDTGSLSGVENLSMSGSITYTVAKSKTKMIPMTAIRCRDDEVMDWQETNGVLSGFSTTILAPTLWVQLDLPHGCIITGVEFLSFDAGNTTLKLQKRTPDFGTPGVGTEADISTTTVTGSGWKHITLSSIAETVDAANVQYFIRMSGTAMQPTALKVHYNISAEE